MPYAICLAKYIYILLIFFGGKSCDFPCQITVTTSLPETTPLLLQNFISSPFSLHSQKHLSHHPCSFMVTPMESSSSPPPLFPLVDYSDDDASTLPQSPPSLPISTTPTRSSPQETHLSDSINPTSSPTITPSPSPLISEDQQPPTSPSPFITIPSSPPPAPSQGEEAHTDVNRPLPSLDVPSDSDDLVPIGDRLLALRAAKAKPPLPSSIAHRTRSSKTKQLTTTATKCKNALSSVAKAAKNVVEMLTAHLLHLLQ